MATEEDGTIIREDGAWPEALIRMEDERDAALLEVERLGQLLDNADKMIADLRGYRDEAMKLAEGIDDQLGDVRWLLTILDSVTAGGGATPGETPAATVTRASGWVQL